jgi:hypothetical protein
MAKLSKAEIEKEVAWLKSYAKTKPIKNFGGNFWGINRKRCTIIKPEMLIAMVAAGYAENFGSYFVMKG